MHWCVARCLPKGKSWNFLYIVATEKYFNQSAKRVIWKYTPGVEFKNGITDCVVSWWLDGVSTGCLQDLYFPVLDAFILFNRTIGGCMSISMPSAIDPMQYKPKFKLSQTQKRLPELPLILTWSKVSRLQSFEGCVNQWCCESLTVELFRGTSKIRNNIMFKQPVIICLHRMIFPCIEVITIIWMVFV